MSAVVPGTGSAEKIVQAASVLFDRSGYQATSVNDIIAEAGVSKPTFYAHFSSKEALCVAYLRYNRAQDIEGLEAAAAAAETPMDRLVSPFKVLKMRMLESDYRGCRYFNMLSEVVDHGTPMAREVRHFNDRFRAHLRRLVLDLKESDDQYAELDADAVADSYCLLFGGAIMMSQETRSLKPVKLAEAQVRRLVA